MSDLVIRADADSRMGTGHVMRCLALAQAWQDVGGSAVFLSDAPAPLRDRVAKEGVRTHAVSAHPGTQDDARELLQLCEALNAHRVVVDGYHFHPGYQQWLRDASLQVLLMDDNGDSPHYYADWVLNQNLHADEGMYASREPHTRLLLGPRYALLRREFFAWRRWQRTIPPFARQVLVTMGGSDPDNVTCRVVQALDHLAVEGMEVVVVVGSANPHLDVVRERVGRSRATMRVQHDTHDMPALMAWADVAICAGGTTSWELAFMGLPSIVVNVADNQTLLAAELERRKVAESLGWHTDLSQTRLSTAISNLLSDSERRAEMNRLGRALVDSLGGERVVTALVGSQPRLRPVGSCDCKLIFEWANDPVVRAMSLSSQAIPWETHQCWFARKLANPNVVHLMALDPSGEPLGQIRFEIDGDSAETHLSIAREQRGKGYATWLINEGARRLRSSRQVRVFRAIAKSENIPSIRAFQRAGFRSMGETQVAGHSVVLLVRTDEG